MALGRQGHWIGPAPRYSCFYTKIEIENFFFHILHTFCVATIMLCIKILDLLLNAFLDPHSAHPRGSELAIYLEVGHMLEVYRSFTSVGNRKRKVLYGCNKTSFNQYFRWTKK